MVVRYFISIGPLTACEIHGQWRVCSALGRPDRIIATLEGDLGADHAHMMAAAPELYNALFDSLPALRSEAADAASLDSEEWKRLRAAENALSKARGKTAALDAKVQRAEGADADTLVSQNSTSMNINPPSVSDMMPNPTPSGESGAEPDLYDPTFQAGVTYAFEAIAQQLGVSNWSIQDGTESAEGDIDATAHALLELAGLFDPETGHRVYAHPSPTWEDAREQAAEAVEGLAQRHDYAARDAMGEGLMQDHNTLRAAERALSGAIATIRAMPKPTHADGGSHVEPIGHMKPIGGGMYGQCGAYDPEAFPVFRHPSPLGPPPWGGFDGPTGAE